jgi:hypothetical protein
MPTPSSVVALFDKRVANALALYDELLLAVDQKKKQQSLETLLAEQCVLGLAVLWEAFVHDLIVAYIVERSDACIRFHKDKVTQSIKAKNELFLKWVRINAPAALSRAQVEMMVDPAGWNITADSAETLAQKANQLLSAPDAIKFSLPDADRKFLDLTIGIRNFLSHRSAGALTIMKKRLGEHHTVEPISPLNGAVTTVGAYLKFRPAGAIGTRAKLIGNRLRTLAAKLV